MTKHESMEHIVKSKNWGLVLSTISRLSTLTKNARTRSSAYILQLMYYFPVWHQTSLCWSVVMMSLT